MVTQRSDQPRSGCAINAAVELIGDRWSLLVLHDVMFGNRRHFRILQERSEGGIASNILADRLRRLAANRSPLPSHG
jgi:DNA-binding HxlR family transcriptional regulator